MNIDQYIASGILELYVAGSLTDAENREVYAMLQKHPELVKEVAHIEAALIELGQEVAPRNVPEIPKVIGREGKKSSLSWFKYAGWAAAIIATAGLTYLFFENDTLKLDLQNMEQRQQYVDEQLIEQQEQLQYSKALLTGLTNKNILKVELPGQVNFSDSYAAVYWNQESQELYVDVNNLPEAPEGMQYQLWSLALNPLTPTSLGVIDNNPELGVVAFSNPNNSQAFGITLEPNGGSETPNLEQLHVLGMVASTP